MSSDDEEGPSGRQEPQQHADPNAELPALFWDTMPENPESHPDYMALQALAEESTPEERAENFKEQGNNKLKAGIKANNRMLMREAVDFYKKGLDLQPSDAVLCAMLHNNTAHVHSLLGNWRKALEHSQTALQQDPASIKACFRGARAALKLSKFEQAAEFIHKGQQLEPDAKELVQLQQEMSKQQQMQQEHAAREAAAQEAHMAPARALAAAISAKGYRLTVPEVSVGTRKPYVDDQGRMHWPLLLMFPEAGQQDVVEDTCEDDVLADHLDVMFGEEAPPLDWDEEHAYTRQNVECYYLANAGRPLDQEQLIAACSGRWPDKVSSTGPKRYGKDAAHWVRADEACSLKQILQAPGHVIPGLPLLWVVAQGTIYRDRFLSEELTR